MASDLTSEQKQVIQSLAKTISGLHKRQWIDDEKKQHYRNILKSMSTRESYNGDTIQRLQKKLDRLKQKQARVGTNIDVQKQQKEEEDIKKKKSQMLPSNDIKNDAKLFYGNQSEREEIKVNISQHNHSNNIKDQKPSSILETTGNHHKKQQHDIQKTISTTQLRTVTVTQEHPNETSKGVNLPMRHTHPLSKTSMRTLHPKSQGGMMQKEDPTSRRPYQALLSNISQDIEKESHAMENINMPISYPSRKILPVDQSDTIPFPSKTSSSSFFLPLIVNPTFIQGKLSHEKIKKMFIEMCAFARLQFVQPPSCLSCTLSKRVTGTSTNRHSSRYPLYAQPCGEKMIRQDCPNYVVWRKNANLKIHPQNMNENIMFVKCASAQALLRGEAINQWKWDAVEKIFEKKC